MTLSAWILHGPRITTKSMTLNFSLCKCKSSMLIRHKISQTIKSSTLRLVISPNSSSKERWLACHLSMWICSLATQPRDTPSPLRVWKFTSTEHLFAIMLKVRKPLAISLQMMELTRKLTVLKLLEEESLSLCVPWRWTSRLVTLPRALSNLARAQETQTKTIKCSRSISSYLRLSCMKENIHVAFRSHWISAMVPIIQSKCLTNPLSWQAKTLASRLCRLLFISLSTRSDSIAGRPERMQKCSKSILISKLKFLAPIIQVTYMIHHRTRRCMQGFAFPRLKVFVTRLLQVATRAPRTPKRWSKSATL